MKKALFFIFFLILFKLASSQAGDYIIIKHIGDQSKPIWPIAIVKKGSDTVGMEKRMRFFVEAPLYKYGVTFFDSTSYKLIDSIIENYKYIIEKEPMPSTSFRFYGSLGITRFINQKEAYYFETYKKMQGYILLDTLYNRFSAFRVQRQYEVGDLFNMLCQLYWAIHSEEILKNNPPPCGALNQRW